MNIKQSKIELLQEVDPEQLLEEEGTVIDLSFKESSSLSNQYPSMHSNSIKDSRGSWKNSRNSHDDIDHLVVGGVKKSSFSLEESNTDDLSLSYLNGSTNEEESTRSKMVQKLKSIREDGPEFSEKDIKMFNQSIFTDRKAKQEIPKKRQSKSPQKHEEEQINYGQSFYMTKQEPVASKPKPTKTPSKEEKKIIVTFSSKNYFLQISEYSVEIDKDSLEDLQSQLFKRELFMPLFSYQRYQEWAKIKDFRKYSLECEAHMNFKVYLDRYIQFLNQRCPKHLEEIIKDVQLIQQGKNEKRSHEQTGLSFFNLNNIIQNFKAMMNSSKLSVLRKTLLSKIRSLISIQKEGQKWSITQQQTATIHKVLSTIWKDLAEVELLLSFESTEQFCSKKIENSPEMKFKQIYIRYREALRKQKSYFMNNLEAVGL